MSYYSQYWTFCTTSPWCNDINLKGASTKLNRDSNWQEVLKLRRIEMAKNFPYWWWNAGCFLHKVVCGLSLDRCQLCDHTLMSWQKWLPHFSLQPPTQSPHKPPEPQWNPSKCAMTIWQDKDRGSVPSAFNLILWRGKLLDERGALVGVRPVRWKLDGLFSNGPPHHLHKCVGSCQNLGTHRYDHSLIKDLQPWSRQWLSLFKPLYEKTVTADWLMVWRYRW